MSFKIEQPTAIVTGAASGIGRATAILLAQKGAKVVCADISQKGCEQTASLIRDEGNAATAEVCDISDPTSVENCIEKTISYAGGIDILVNAAGIFLKCNASEISLEQWNKVINTNLTGTFLLTQAALPELLKSQGCVVNIGSAAGVRARAYLAAYSASKAAVIHLTKSLAMEYAANNVRFNSICPGGVDTNMAKGAINTVVSNKNEALQQRTASLLPQGLSSPQEIAEAVCYLASDEARFITGAALMIDGGSVV